jgi:hypothetical protein
MIQSFAPFAKQVLSFTGFKSSRISKKAYQALLTAFEGVFQHEVVMIEPLIKLVKRCSGKLILDDTSNPKYGMKQLTRKLKILTNGGYHQGYKILLFLWECEYGRIPVGFGLWHKGTKPISELSLEGMALLRNRYRLKPKAVVADGAFSTDKILKRLENYGWPCVMRARNDRKLGNHRAINQIARGYGSQQGRLKNGTKVKIFRRKNRLYVCNRMLWDMRKAVEVYTKRWKIEEVFRALKQCLRLNRCQQHSMRAQAMYLIVCLILFACLEVHSEPSVYKLAHSVISGQVPLETILDKRIFQLC